MFKMNHEFGYINEIEWNSKGKTFAWHAGDTEKKFKENMINHEALMKKLKWDVTPIKYKISKYGLRYDGEEQKPGGVMWVGGSNVFGTGNHYEDNFTYIAHNIAYPELPYYNLGCCGYGIETYYRIIRYNIERLKPTKIVLDEPHVETRAEDWNGYTYIAINPTFVIENNKPKYLDNSRSFDKTPATTRWFKNMDAIRYLCYKYNVEFIYKGMTMKWIQMHMNDRSARDLSHNGPTWHLSAGKLLAGELYESDHVD